MPPKLQKQIEGILRQIPGYDPWAQAEGVGAWLDHQAALDAINWFADHLKHVEGDARGVPFILRPWQAAIIGNLFGWKRKDEQGRIVRRYRKCLLYVPRGNGKSPLASGIVLYVFFCDHEPGAQNYLAAGQREQAGILFRNARGMVEQDPELLARVTVYGGDQHRSLVLKDDPMSFCRVIPADAAGQHGGIPHITAVDELHVQESRDLVDVFETAMAKKVRAQPLLVMLTTADYDRPSICNEVYDHACRVRDNGGDKNKPGYDPTFLPVIYEAAEADDWRDEATWMKANPNMGVSVARESFKAACLRAQENPAFENTFRRLHLNQRTKQDTRLVPMEAWDACDRPIDLADLAGRPCYGGLDLASREDLASLCLLFPLEDEYWAVLSFSWCPEDKVKTRARQKFPYDLWARQGFLTATEGNEIDYATIRRQVDELASLYQIREIGYDPHGATQLAQELQRDYGDGFVVYITQSFRNLSAPTKEVLRRIKLGKIIHGGNPVLRWATSNVAAHIDGKIPDGSDLTDYLDKVPVMPSKRKSADKIDPFAALVNAAARLQAHPENDGRSVYEDRGLLTL